MIYPTGMISATQMIYAYAYEGNGYYITFAPQIYHTALPYIISLGRYIIKNTSIQNMSAFCSPIPHSRQVRYEHSISLPFWGFSTNQELLEQVYACSFCYSSAVRISVLLPAFNPFTAPDVGQAAPACRCRIFPKTMLFLHPFPLMPSVLFPFSSRGQRY